MATDQTKDLLAGKYGVTVKPFNPEVQKKGYRRQGSYYLPSCRPAS